MSDETSPNPSPFDQIVDDYAPRRQAVDWAIHELTAGKSFEEVAANLAENQWSAADVEAIVEEARQKTRALRGAISRSDIVYDADKRYRAAMGGGWFVGFPSVAAAMRLLQSLASLASLRRFRRQDSDDRDA